jgi:peptidylprolyl isomerase
LCTGEKGIGESGKLLHYKGSKFHRCVKDFICQGGDITRHNGSGGESIYGRAFADESFSGKAARHLKYSVVMASSGPNTNNSQFYITMRETPWLDGKGVVFGEVVGGEEVLLAINDVGTQLGSTTKPVVIVDCGQCPNETFEAPGLWGSSGPRGHETMQERDLDNQRRWRYKMEKEKEKAELDIVRGLGVEGMSLNAGEAGLGEKLKEEHGLEVAHEIVKRGSVVNAEISVKSVDGMIDGAQAKGEGGGDNDSGKKTSDDATSNAGEGGGSKAEAKQSDEDFLASEAKGAAEGAKADSKESKDLRPESATTAKSEADTEGGSGGEGEGGDDGHTEEHTEEQTEDETGHTEDEHDDTASRDDDHPDDDDPHDDDDHEVIQDRLLVRYFTKQLLFPHHVAPNRSMRSTTRRKKRNIRRRKIPRRSTMKRRRSTRRRITRKKNTTRRKRRRSMTTRSTTMKSTTTIKRDEDCKRNPPVLYSWA